MVLQGKKNLKLSIIIPTYNESATICEIISYVNAVQYPIEHELIIVDDASSDRTYEKEMILRSKEKHKNLKLFRNQINRGKGASVRTGIQHASGDIMIIQDADTEYAPKDIPRLIQPILNGEADAVFGSRFMNCRWPEGMAFPNWIGNKILTALTNLLFGLSLTDEATCYKAIRTKLVRKMHLRTNRFAIDPEINAKLAKMGARIIELPIAYQARSAKQGKKIKAKDLIYAVITLLYNRFAKI
jgi:glycosyltransferase involved in cell wall biosynthesis